MAIIIEQLYLILTYAGIVQGVFVASLLTNKNVRQSRANIFLSILLLVLSFSILHMRYAGLVFNHFAVPAYPLGDPTLFLIAPLLWFYVNELTGHKIALTLQSFFHFAPFIVIIGLSLLLKDLAPAHSLLSYLDGHQRQLSIFFWLLVVSQFSGYLFFVTKKWRAYQQIMEQEVSNTEHVNIAWVRFFLGIFLFINLFFLFTLFAQIHLANVFWFRKTIAAIFSLSIFALGYKGILQKELFQLNRKENSLLTSTPSLETPTKQADEELINRLLRYMDDQKPYLDPELTLSSLAKAIGLS